jgi:hypothetical protein
VTGPVDEEDFEAEINAVPDDSDSDNGGEASGSDLDQLRTVLAVPGPDAQMHEVRKVSMLILVSDYVTSLIYALTHIGSRNSPTSLQCNSVQTTGPQETVSHSLVCYSCSQSQLCAQEDVSTGLQHCPSRAEVRTVLSILGRKQPFPDNPSA